MKKITAILLILILLLTLPFSAAADITYSLEITPPTKTVYTVGEKADYSGGRGIYTAQTEITFELSALNCSGLDTSEPGVKTVTVTMGACKEYFHVVVLSAEEPITAMRDITREHWAYKSFASTMKAGFFRGDENHKLNPNAPITRAEMATLIHRAWQSDPTVMTDRIHSEPFTDVPAEFWGLTAIEACRKAGVIKGVGDGAFAPSTPITRQDAVLMLMRIRYTEQELAEVNVAKTVAASGVRATDFNKVSDYAKAAMALALGDLITGNPDGTIAPLSPITRAETSAIFYRLFLDGYQWTPPAKGTLIYLSPSRQFANSYAAGGTNEGDQMYRIAEALKPLLEAQGYTVHIADRNKTIYERTVEGNEMGADLYIPIHSNAGGGVGTRMFYNGAIEGSYELSKSIFDYLSVLTNTPLNKNNLKEDYLSLMPNGKPFEEIKTPTMPMAYIEVEFHDIKEKALWIIANIDPMAQAIANGIIDYCENYL
ncbi:MAG: S-layer homology domain-containing protein [Clostridia bacterium]|nr:S-layer homology domain-containing protein [Clostridia bacterium]